MFRRHIFVRLCLMLLLSVSILPSVRAQRVGIKTNALGWVAASPNLGVEFRPSRHFTLNIEALASPLKMDKLRTTHLTITPEVRYWFSARPQAGHFVGINALASAYHLAWNDTHHRGDAFGAGVTYGYSWVLGRRWSLEATAGIGLLHQRDKEFADGTLEPASPNNSRTRLAPTKLGVSFVYILK